MPDLIDRQAVLEALETAYNGGGMQYETYSEMFDEIDNMPNCASGWVSVEDEKPKDHKAVNVVWVNHNPVSYYADIKNVPQTGTAHYYKPNDSWYWDSPVCDDYLDEYGRAEWRVDEAIDIIYWQPLPEPPEVSDKNDQA